MFASSIFQHRWMVWGLCLFVGMGTWWIWRDVRLGGLALIGTYAVLWGLLRMQSRSSSQVQPTMEITGTMVFEDVEGGFWGILGDDGRKYLPVQGLPKKAQKRNLKVRAQITPANVMTAQMWGRAINIVNLETL